MLRRTPYRFSITIFILCCITYTVLAQPKVTFTGDAQYRIRYHYVMQSDVDGKDSSAAPDLINMYGWNLAAKITVNENLLFGIRLSNPKGSAADAIDGNLKFVSNTAYNILSIPEFYFKWSIGQFYLSAGIIPVLPNSVLNLVAYETAGYTEAGANDWTTNFNNSQKGLDIGYTFVKQESVDFGMTVMMAMAYDAPGTDKADALKYDQIRLLTTFPVTISKGMLSLLPAGHFRFNAFRSDDLKEANHSAAGGLDVKYKPITMLSVYAGAAGGMFDNSSVETNTADTVIPGYAPLGVLVNGGFLIEPGFGKGCLDFNFGRSRDREAAKPLNHDLLYWDIKYEFPIKTLSIMPRFRIWYLTTEDADRTELRLRPEFILKAKF